MNRLRLALVSGVTLTCAVLSNTTWGGELAVPEWFPRKAGSVFNYVARISDEDGDATIQAKVVAVTHTDKLYQTTVNVTLRPKDRKLKPVSEDVDFLYDGNRLTCTIAENPVHAAPLKASPAENSEIQVEVPAGEFAWLNGATITVLPKVEEMAIEGRAWKDVAAAKFSLKGTGASVHATTHFAPPHGLLRMKVVSQNNDGSFRKSLLIEIVPDSTTAP
jgi:hypothetical protein